MRRLITLLHIKISLRAGYALGHDTTSCHVDILNFFFWKKKVNTFLIFRLLKNHDNIRIQQLTSLRRIDLRHRDDGGY